MRVWALTLKAGRELARNKISLFFMLLFPLMFMLIFGAAFGSFSGGNTTYDIAVINLDEGTELDGEAFNHGESLEAVFKDMMYRDKDGENTSTHVFDVRTDLTADKAQEMVEDRNLAAYIIIPANFSEAVSAEAMRYVYTAVSMSLEESMGGDWTAGEGVPGAADIQDMMDGTGGTGDGGDEQNDTVNGTVGVPGNGTGGNAPAGAGGVPPNLDRNASAEVALQGDPGQASFFTVASIIDGVVAEYVRGVGERTLEMTAESLPFPVDPSVTEPRVRVVNEVLASSDLSAFDYTVPGVIVFALLMGTTGVAIFMVREESKGTLNRLKLTKMRSSDLLLGTTIPFLVLSVIQVLILLGVALLMGYKYYPGANIPLALFIAGWGCLATVGLGLIIAALAKNEDQAGSLGPAIAVPLSFLTGAFFPLPTVVLSDDFLGTGRTFELFDWLPWTQCSKGLSKVFTYGAGVGDVALEIGMLIAGTMVLFVIGVALYHNRRLRAL